MISLIHHPDGPKRLGDLLIENLSAAKATAKWTGKESPCGAA